MDLTCSVADCPRIAKASRGMCWPHYRRWLTTGDPQGGSPVFNRPEDRFWAKVDRTEGEKACWPWLAYCKPNGYGSWGQNGYAHRAAWQFTFGPVPRGLQVCHHCDNPCCCNPAHLFLGTPRMNMQDMIVKGRKRPARGERSHWARLQQSSVQTIRRQMQ